MSIMAIDLSLKIMDKVELYIVHNHKLVRIGCIPNLGSEKFSLGKDSVVWTWVS